MMMNSSQRTAARFFLVAIPALASITCADLAHSQPGWVLSHQKISDTEGGFTGTLDDGDVFGDSVASLGDLDGDGVGDLAVGAPSDDDGGSEHGAVWILFLHTDGTVKSRQKISDTEGGFTGTLDDLDGFGGSTASLGDLDGDGVGDLAVGASHDDDGGDRRGAVWVLFLNKDGTVKSHQKICDTEGGFTGTYWMITIASVGIVASLGDLDGDRVGDLAVGAYLSMTTGAQTVARCGCCFSTPTGRSSRTRRSATPKAASLAGWMIWRLVRQFNAASLGDLDGDGVVDLAVSAPWADDGGLDRGQVWILFLNTDGTVKSQQKIGSTAGGFTGKLDDGIFGQSLASLGDLDGDGVGDLAAGQPWNGDGGTRRGAVWVLFLNTDGTVKSHQKISDTEGGFTGILGNWDFFGETACSLGDLDGDGVDDLAVGVPGDDDGGPERGALWILFLNTDGTVKAHQKISDTEGGFTGILDDGGWFSWTPNFLGDLDGDGKGDLAVGALFDDDGGPDRGAVWILFLDGVIACPEDLDGSGAVDFADILAILSAWGNAGGPEDLNGSGTVDFGDLLVVLGAWGRARETSRCRARRTRPMTAEKEMRCEATAGLLERRGPGADHVGDARRPRGRQHAWLRSGHHGRADHGRTREHCR